MYEDIDGEDADGGRVNDGNDGDEVESDSANNCDDSCNDSNTLIIILMV